MRNDVERQETHYDLNIFRIPRPKHCGETNKPWCDLWLIQIVLNDIFLSLTFSYRRAYNLFCFLRFRPFSAHLTSWIRTHSTQVEFKNQVTSSGIIDVDFILFQICGKVNSTKIYKMILSMCCSTQRAERQLSTNERHPQIVSVWMCLFLFSFFSAVSFSVR